MRVRGHVCVWFGKWFWISVYDFPIGYWNWSDVFVFVCLFILVFVCLFLLLILFCFCLFLVFYYYICIIFLFNLLQNELDYFTQGEHYLNRRRWFKTIFRNTHIHDPSLSCLGTGTSIKYCGVNVKYTPLLTKFLVQYIVDLIAWFKNKIVCSYNAILV
jgi:hypothetical protein